MLQGPGGGRFAVKQTSDLSRAGEHHGQPRHAAAEISAVIRDLARDWIHEDHRAGWVEALLTVPLRTVPEGGSATIAWRGAKLCPHLLFSDYDWVIYIGNSANLLIPPQQIVAQIEAGQIEAGHVEAGQGGVQKVPPTAVSIGPAGAGSKSRAARPCGLKIRRQIHAFDMSL